MTSNSVEGLLKAMTHYDKDNRFMAASDLVNHITSGKVDPSAQSKITSALLEQFSDPSVEVQGHAVKCIARIVATLTAAELTEIIKKITEKLINGDEQLRDVYAICFESFLPELPDSIAETVWRIVLERCVQVPPEATERCLSLLVAVLCRFGRTNFWRTEISRLAEFSRDAISGKLKRRGVALLGALASQGAPPDLLLATCGSDVATLAAIAKGSGNSFAPFSESILPLFIGPLQKVDLDDERQWGEAEVCLSGIEAVLPFTSRAKEVIEITRNFSEFDPFFHGECSEEYEIEDSSWKLRKAAVRVLAIGGGCDFLIDRLNREREETVLLEILRGLPIACQSDPQSCSAAASAIFNLLNTKTGKVASGAVSALIALTHKFPCPAHPTLTKALKSAKSVTDSLEILKLIGSVLDASSDPLLVESVAEACGNPSPKVAASAFRIAEKIGGKFLVHASDVMRKSECDPELRDAAVSAFVEYTLRNFHENNTALGDLFGILDSPHEATRTIATRHFASLLKGAKSLAIPREVVSALVGSLDFIKARQYALRSLYLLPEYLQSEVFGRLRKIPTALLPEESAPHEAIALTAEAELFDERNFQGAVKMAASPYLDVADSLGHYFAGFTKTPEHEELVINTLLPLQTERAVMESAGRILSLAIKHKEFIVIRAQQGEPVALVALGNFQDGLDTILSFATQSQEPARSAACVGLHLLAQKSTEDFLLRIFRVAENCDPNTAAMLLHAVAPSTRTAGDSTRNFLIKFATVADESLRQAVAECICYAPFGVSLCGELLGSEGVNNVLAGLAAVKVIKGKDISALERNFQVCISSKDLTIRRAASLALVGAAENGTIGALFGHKIDGRAIISRLLDDLQIRPELIKEVDLGPFKHKVDEGLPLRKASALAILSFMKLGICSDEEKVVFSKYVGEQKELQEMLN